MHQASCGSDSLLPGTEGIALNKFISDAGQEPPCNM